MAIFLSSALAVTVLAQGGPADSIARLWARVAEDSSDRQAWFQLGRAYMRLSAEYHLHRPLPPPLPPPRDTAWARAVLDTADQAFARAALPPAGGAEAVAGAVADSARVFRVYAWGERAILAWELGGVDAAAQAWGSLPAELKLPPVLEELGENLLRACPRRGVLLTAADADSYAARYMRLVRRFRPDLLIVPFALWRTDTVFRARVSAELKLGHVAARGGTAHESRWLRTLVERRPVCASMGFDRAPETRPQIRWRARPLVWVAGPDVREDRVPPRDFDFAALRLALDRQEVWAEPALVLYRRAAAVTPALCEPLRTFGLTAEVGCRR